MDIEDFFDKETMSVHIRENSFPYAKKGSPGNWTFEKIKNKKINQEDLKEIAQTIMQAEDSLVEIDRQGSTIIQKGIIRIVITRPPFSDGWEITAVKPVKLLALNEYNISENLFKRIKEQAEGILIAGPPGQGKTTFARALALFYADNNKIVKTVESPRDLILPENITQLAISHGSPEEIRDILLLSRPDYTIFDEMRNTEDFRLFSDLRLSGVGMAGVIHATNSIDAIQRFIGRIELGVIPQIIDTVIFVEKGEIKRVFDVKMTVKVPSGMKDIGLTRPVVVINDFETGKLEYEIYSYGEETVVIPVNSSTVLVKSEKKEKIEKILKKMPKNYENVKFGVKIEKRYLFISPEGEYSNKEVSIYVEEKFLMNVKVSKKNIIKINLESDKAKELYHSLVSKKKIELRI